LGLLSLPSGKPFLARSYISAVTAGKIHAARRISKLLPSLVATWPSRASDESTSPTFFSRFFDLRNPAAISLTVTGRLAAASAANTAAVLRNDLQNVVRAYRALTFRGGIEGDVEPQAELEDEFNIPAQATVIETRKYAFHRKIERNRTAAKQAKKFHGTRCQACDLNFEQRYGEIGKGFIEAHHLKPIASLEEGVAVTYDVAADFAVLCANCHRMIHRSDDPSNLSLFKKNLAAI
jgi:hypothetical protein